MRGIEKITARIRGDAEREGEALMEAARRDSEALADSYRQKAAELSEVLTEKSQREARDYESRLTNAAALDARKRQLAVRQELLDEAFASGLQTLLRLPLEEKQALLADIAAKASLYGKEEVVLNAEDAKDFGKALVGAANKKLAEQNRPGGLVLAKRTHGFLGGLLLVDGDVTVNCSFETLISQKREDLAAEIAALLFA